MARDAPSLQCSGEIAKSCKPVWWGTLWNTGGSKVVFQSCTHALDISQDKGPLTRDQKKALDLQTTRQGPIFIYMYIYICIWFSLSLYMYICVSKDSLRPIWRLQRRQEVCGIEGQPQEEWVGTSIVYIFHIWPKHFFTSPSLTSFPRQGLSRRPWAPLLGAMEAVQGLASKGIEAKKGDFLNKNRSGAFWWLEGWWYLARGWTSTGLVLFVQERPVSYSTILGRYFGHFQPAAFGYCLGPSCFNHCFLGVPKWTLPMILIAGPNIKCIHLLLRGLGWWSSPSRVESPYPFGGCTVSTE